MIVVVQCCLRPVIGRNWFLENAPLPLSLSLTHAYYDKPRHAPSSMGISINENKQNRGWKEYSPLSMRISSCGGRLITRTPVRPFYSSSSGCNFVSYTLLLPLRGGMEYVSDKVGISGIIIFISNSWFGSGGGCARVQMIQRPGM